MPNELPVKDWPKLSLRAKSEDLKRIRALWHQDCIERPLPFYSWAIKRLLGEV